MKIYLVWKRSFDNVSITHCRRVALLQFSSGRKAEDSDRMSGYILL